ncbi:MAG: DUF1667 domain-containing protein [Clostridia bacterium]
MKFITCINCPNSCQIQCAQHPDGSWTFAGHRCNRGVAYAEAELTHPVRSLTSTVRTGFPGVPVIPVRTRGEVPKELLFEVMRVLRSITVKTRIGIGDIVLPNVLGTGCDVICTSDCLMACC